MKPIIALALFLSVQSVYSMGLFPHHRSDGSTASGGHSGGDVVGVVPEPETYVLMAVGIGAVIYIARRRKK